MAKVFPIFIDNTALSSFKRCPRSWYYSSILKIVPKGGNIHLHAGAAYAKGLEVGRKAFHMDKLSEDDAIAQGLHAFLKFWGDTEIEHGTAKSLDRMFYALLECFLQYPMDTDVIQPAEFANGARGIEYSFALPMSINNPDTGEPLIFTGRFDMLGVYQEAHFGEDDKTASQLGASWMKNWDLDSQFTGYSYAAREYGHPLAGFIVRGISILKTGYGHAQAIVYRPQRMLTDWKETTDFVVQSMLRHYKHEFYPKILDKHSCNSYGGCPYSTLCQSPTPEAWIEQYYEPNDWNPLAKD